jgi:hypothetical protein
MQDYTWPNLSDEQQANLVLEAQRFSNNPNWKSFAKRTLPNFFTTLDVFRKDFEEDDSWGHRIGVFKSLRWQHFVLDVMREALNQGFFRDEKAKYRIDYVFIQNDERMIGVVYDLLRWFSSDLMNFGFDLDKWRKAHNKN